ncbi:MAG: helix-turn-helix domain-containing protein [Terriglobales bacterium]
MAIKINKSVPSPKGMDFALRLKALREHCGILTARELAKKLDMMENTYTRYERAETRPDILLIPKLCRALGVTPTEFFAYTIPADGRRRK